MAKVGPGRTDLPSVWINGVECALDKERYSDDAVVLEALVETPEQQDAVAPRYRVRHVPAKEAYLFMDLSTKEAKGTPMVIRHLEYAHVACRKKR